MSTINFPLQKTLLYAASSTWHPDTLQMLHLDNCYTGIKRHALSHLSSRSKKCFPNISRNLSVSIGNPTRNFSVSLPNFPTPEQEMENAAQLRHGAGLYRDQTIETGTLSGVVFLTSPTLWHFNDVFITSQRVSFVTDRRDNEQRCIQCISVVIMFPRPRLKTLFKTFNVRLKKIHLRDENIVNFARNVIWTVQWSQLLVKTQVLDQNLQQIILAAICIFPPGFHTFYILWRGYLVISRQLTREFTPVWSQSPSSKYSNILKWVRERFNRLWVISMCFYWMLSISSISFKATIKSSFAFVSDWRISWNILLMP